MNPIRSTRPTPSGPDNCQETSRTSLARDPPTSASSSSPTASRSVETFVRPFAPNRITSPPSFWNSPESPHGSLNRRVAEADANDRHSGLETGVSTSASSPLARGSFSTPDDVVSDPLASGPKRRRPSEGAHENGLGVDDRPSPKKPRQKLRPRHFLELSSSLKRNSSGSPGLSGFSSIDQSPLSDDPPPNGLPPKSPLFFSHNGRHRRPPLHARFSSSEAAATMLTKARDESEGAVTTVKLPRGNFNGRSPPSRATSTPGGRTSHERGSIPRSMTPDAGESPTTGLQILSQIGIIELLEQDERPTFLVDLGNSANLGPGALHVVFANVALRSRERLLESISGSSSQSSVETSPSGTFWEFKAWALGSFKDSERLDVASPTFTYEELNWTCSTLRKRLRLISCNASLSPIKGRKWSALPVSSPTVPEFGSPGTLAENITKESLQYIPKIAETPDYFGTATISETISGGISPGEVDDRPLSSSKSTALPASINLSTSDLSPEGARISAIKNLSGKDDVPNADSQEMQVMMAPRKLDRGFFDWTRLTSSPSLPEHVQFALGVDWSATDLGPIDEWSYALRGMCNLIMASPHPAAMYWGEGLTTIYNEAYVQLAGQKHPQLMGQPYKEAWAEIWDALQDVFTSALTTGQATMKDDDCLFLRRSDFLEETYFSWAIIPLVGEDGSVVGLYNPAFEKTRRKIAERRMLTLREVGERTATARELTSFWGQVMKGLEHNERDAPFALLYTVSDDIESDVSSTQSSSLTGSKQCILASRLGVPEDHPAAQSPLELKTSYDGFGPLFREALRADKPIVFKIEDDTLSPQLLEGLNLRGFGDPCRAAVVCPIHPTTGEATLGFLVMGINPRRPYDEDYDLFVQLLTRQLATSMASVVLFEEEIRRGQQAANLAARDRFELSEQLAARTQEVEESETKFTRMAEFAPVGMFIANSEGQITYCNDTWYEISRHPREAESTRTWLNSVKDEDRATVTETWRNLVVNKVPMNLEFRFKAPWQGRNEVKGDTWVLGSAYPEKNEDGSLKSIFGSLTNISQQKWAEDFQKKRMEEAVELKRQQENFIDITSHEMRNPLSAILQCADEISVSLSDYRAKEKSLGMTVDELLSSSVDAAQTIALCAQHQKRIVDDILTLSKLDSALLLVTPVDVQPISVVQRTLKMFEGELETNDIALNFQVLDSYKALEIDWVRLDPSRLLQVLINLTTNAIKFTQNQQSRTITVSIDASLERPSRELEKVVSYFPARSRREDPTAGSDWGTGDEIYIHFAIEDTGRGLSENERKLLFLRFSQASPRTHVQYGGSGLGLFISRELTELQGGEIGVTSESGVGSTFAFYVKARRSTRPTDTSERMILPQTRKSGSGKPTHRMASGSGLSRESVPSARLSEDGKGKGAYKVLIVEDNLVNQRVLLKQLRNYGCDVQVANHGGEALDRLRETTFWRNHQESGKLLNVILMDLEMPVMDGLTCSRKIRELQRSGEIVSHVPIIAVTANARPEQINTAIEAGMDDVIPKPFRIPELMPKIAELNEKYG
ncbi:MAG: hypothetical protein M1837_007505 [Sclerophora amabilis]|nr:MAG: hypothetical protein M1837_007505 [Sclerophora amabilis]